MKTLDFSGVFNKGEDNGFIPVNVPDNPFAPPPFVDHTGSRNYKRLYRIAHDYHQRHNPPIVARDYWKDHIPGEDEIPEAEAQYWKEAAEDIKKTATGDQFLSGLLLAIYRELESEYENIRKKAHGSA